MLPTRAVCLQGGHLGTGPLAPIVHYIYGGMVFLHSKSDNKLVSCQAIFTRFVLQAHDKWSPGEIQQACIVNAYWLYEEPSDSCYCVALRSGSFITLATSKTKCSCHL